MPYCQHCEELLYNTRECSICGAFIGSRCPECGAGIWHQPSNYCSRCGKYLGPEKNASLKWQNLHQGIRRNPTTSWLRESEPQIHPSACIDPAAVVIGHVVVEKNVMICPKAVIRADEGAPIIIGEGTNVQDGVVMHALKYGNISIGKHCSIAHGATVHGPSRIGDHTFVGFNSVIVSSNIGKNAYVSHLSLVKGVCLPDCCLVPDGMVINDQEKVPKLEHVKPEHAQFNQDVLDVNQELRSGYNRLF